MARPAIYLFVTLTWIWSGLAQARSGTERLVLQLVWDHQFQFAGFYVADWHGYFSEEGIEVEIRSRFLPDGTLVDMAAEVDAGRADIGIDSAGLLVARDRGRDLVIIASLFQRDPFVFVTRRDADLKAPSDLLNARVGYRKGSVSEAVLRAMLRAEGVRSIPVSPASPASLEALFRGEIDAAPEYRLSATWLAAQAGIPINVLSPASYGIDFYGDSLFVHRRMIDRDPELIGRFLRAVRKGWEQALADPGPTAERIALELPRVKPVGGDLVAYNLAQVDHIREAMLFPAVEIGHINRARWGAMHTVLKADGLVTGTFDSRAALFDPQHELGERLDRAQRLSGWFALSVLAAFLAAGVWIWTLRRAVGARTAVLESALTSLKESEEKFRVIADATPVPIAITRKSDGQFLFVNEEAARRSGVTRAELLKRSVISLWDLRADRDHTMEKLRREGRLRGHEIRVHDTNGAPQVHLLNAETIRLGGEEATLACSVDVSELKQAHAALQASEARLAGILAIAPEAIVSVDGDNRIRIFNHGAEQIFGYRGEEVLGQPIDLLIPEEARSRHRQLTKNFRAAPAQTRLMTERGEIRARRKNGEEFPAEASIAKLNLADDALVTVTLRDIAQRKATESALIESMTRAEAASRAKSEFLAMMSHELRTPLNAMLGFAEIIAEGVMGPVGNAQYQEYANHVVESGRHLLGIITDILDLTKIEAGKLEIQESTVRLASVIRSVARLLHERATRGEVALSVEAADRLPAIRADERKLKQILFNLVSNAIKFTPAGGRITLKASVDERGLVLQVADTGIGMAAADIPKAMEPFEQIDSGLNRKHEGTGLGLPLAKALAELHGGTIEVESAVGAGTVVTVRLPLSRFVQEPAPFGRTA